MSTTLARNKTIDRDMVIKTLSLFHGDNSTFEIRVLGVDGRKTRTDSGYFRDPIKAAEAVQKHANNSTAAAYYFTINPTDGRLHARSKDRIKQYAESTTADSEILLRKWLFIDFDVNKPTGISASAEEHNKAIDDANSAVEWLKEIGFPDAIVADSGNGAHVHFPINVPHDSDSTNLIKDVLAVLSERYSDDTIKVDGSVFNPSRICRLYGTLTGKGDDTDERPHRVSQLLYVPDYLAGGWTEAEAVTADLLRKISDLKAPKRNPDVPTGQPRNSGNLFSDRTDLSKLLLDHGVEYRAAEGSAEYPVKLHITCPFDASHNGKDCYVAQRSTGALIFHCSHDSCANNRWQEFKAAVGIAVRKPWTQSSSHRIAEPQLMTVMASEVEPKELDWLWRHRFLIGNVNIIGGDPGLGKSLITIDMAARASTGREWPDGSPCNQCSVLYSTTEDGIEDTVVPRLIAASADLGRVHIVQGVKCVDDSELPLLLNEHMRFLDDKLTANPEIRILIIDTLQSHIGSAVATNNNASVRGVMTPLKRLAEKHHIAAICIEHLTKSKTERGDNATYRVQGSIAFAGAARSVWIVAKDQYDQSGSRRYLQASKTNLAPDNQGLGLAYEICGPTGKPYIRWLETDITTPIGDLLMTPEDTSEGRDGSELGKCMDWIRSELTEAMQASELGKGADAAGFSKATFRRAKEQLGVSTEKRGKGWYSVPSADMEQSRENDLIEAAEF